MSVLQVRRATPADARELSDGNMVTLLAHGDGVLVAYAQLRRRGMGVRFQNLRPEAAEQLDDFLVAFLRDRISKSTPVGHRPGWLTERHIIV